MKRFAIEQLKQWKDKKDRKPLIIRGARQVGKTWLMKEFGRTCFDNVAYVNFDSNARMKNVFDGEIDIPRIIMAISIETGMTIDSHNTLIIFDEIQEVPKALSSLKYFCENAPEYAVVAAGSLLGVALHTGTSFPVGKVDFMDLYPLSYQEFLCALGEERYVDVLKGEDTSMVSAFSSKYIDRLREYYYVGGMPEVVASYVENKDFNRVREIQKNLLNYYRQDFQNMQRLILFHDLILCGIQFLCSLRKKIRNTFMDRSERAREPKILNLQYSGCLIADLFIK